MGLANLVFHPIYSQLSLPVRHRFPIEKYQGIYDALIQKGLSPDQFVTPQPLEVEALKSVFSRHYIQQLVSNELPRQAMRRIGFPWSEQLIERTLTAAGGTVKTCELALKYGKALNLTGGYHHAFSDFGSGFCMVNDLYLGALKMLQNPAVDRVLIVDCDVHQGDGTAKLAQHRNDIMTLSIHAEKNFPYRKQVSDLDFPLEKGVSDEDYLTVLDEALSIGFRLAQPDAVIYDAGVDVHEHDDLGYLKLTTDGVYARDRLVFDYCDAAGVPVAAVIGGGYQRDIPALVDVHLQLFRAAGAF